MAGIKIKLTPIYYYAYLPTEGEFGRNWCNHEMPFYSTDFQIAAYFFVLRKLAVDECCTRAVDIADSI
jgi:hypothetical protein